MAEISSSSSTNLIQQKCDVFINFRGIDTRDNILSHLYAALCRKQIVAFIDDQLRRGDDVSESLLRTIKESKISVVIFSENYGSSRWCLDELVHIMECKKQNGQIVIPVFFKVDPSHVKNQSGLFGQALARYESHPKIQIWRDALTEAANLSGWDSQVTRPEAILIEKIIGDILNKLYYASSSDNYGLVGIRSRIQRIESMLNACTKDVRIIGIWGMGGIGKSTLAGAFFNEMFTEFEGHCFLANVREESQKHGVNILRNKLLAEVLNCNINVTTPHLACSFITKRLRRIKVLIVLDDVDDPYHLEFLVGMHDWFEKGSVIIITCRDKQVLQNGVDCIYEIPGMDKSEAFSFFSRYAFKKKHGIHSYQQMLISNAITYAKGNPLALRILGSHMHGKTKQEQKSVLMKLKRTPIKVLQQVLLTSYDGLDYEERKLFLNISILFKGEHVDQVKSFHDACDCYTDSGIRVLIDKSLITVDKGQIWMHDLLQEMGRQIIREECIEEPGKRSRLWDHVDISHVFTENTGTEEVKAILLDSFEIILSINSVAFKKMRNIEFLKFKCPQISCPQGLEYLPNKLRYLDWSGYPLPSLPMSFCPENLVVLKMIGSHLQRLWNGRQNLVCLKEIDLSCSINLVEIPDLSLATNLQTLSLSRCWKLENVSVKNNYNLKHLNLDNCFLIKKFPEVPLGIEHLELRGTGIKEVPSSIFNVKFLSFWSPVGCKSQKSLQYIRLCLSSNEKENQEVNMQIKEVPGWLSGVIQLDLSSSNINEIPIAIKQLTYLTDLIIFDCKKLQSLPQLPMNVTNIRAQNCLSLEIVASPLAISTKGVFNFPKEIKFFFANCPKLGQIALKSIVADAESRLLHWRGTYPEDFSKVTQICSLSFAGDDVPYWFNYKTSGSSLIANLPANWCNDELCCLVCSIVLEFKDAYRYPGAFIYYKCHIRNNRGDSCSSYGCFSFVWKTEDAIQSNQVSLNYSHLFVNDWRMIPKEADNVDKISVEFDVNECARKYCMIKECGVHLLYTHDI